jgi:biofilm protein TabA
MILDRLENAGIYHPLGEKLKLALDYLCRTDLANTPDGRYPLDGDEVYAIVQRYRPKPVAAAQWEAHRVYTDVQYVVEGIEKMGYAPLTTELSICQPYNPEKDVVFYNAQGLFFDVGAGSFAVFSPYDVHSPGLAPSQTPVSRDVCKVVVKCRMPERYWIVKMPPRQRER